MDRFSAADVRKFGRFILTGIIAACGNVSAVWLVHLHKSFEISLLAGMVAGLTISFVLSKRFVFGSSFSRRVGGEALRFVLVYATSSALYSLVALSSKSILLNSFHLSTGVAEFAAILAGAATMLFTSYIGHRFFTYSSNQNAAEHSDRQ